MASTYSMSALFPSQPRRLFQSTDRQRQTSRDPVVELGRRYRSEDLRAAVATEEGWFAFLRATAGPPTPRPAMAARVSGRPRLSEDERRWMRVCLRSFTYFDRDGRRSDFQAGLTYVAPESEYVKAHPERFGPSDRPYGNGRTAYVLSARR